MPSKRPHMYRGKEKRQRPAIRISTNVNGFDIPQINMVR